MAKYRLLTSEELGALEKDFIDYLIINGITADEWVRIKEADISRAEQIIDLFSDVVFEKVLRQVKFLEKHEKNKVVAFECGIENLKMVTMESEDPDVDFLNPGFIAEAAASPPDDLLIYKAEKPYHKVREAELYEMIDAGCLVSDGKLYRSLMAAIKQI